MFVVEGVRSEDVSCFPQDSLHCLLMRLMYTSDLSMILENIRVSFADD